MASIKRLHYLFTKWIALTGWMCLFFLMVVSLHDTIPVTRGKKYYNQAAPNEDVRNRCI